MKKLLNFLVSRIVIVAVLIIAQLIFVLFIVWALSSYALQAYGFFTFLSIISVIYIINKHDNPSYKLTWCVLIVAVPIFGGILYLLFGGKKVPKGLRRNILRSSKETLPLLSQDSKLLEEIKADNPYYSKQFSYIWNNVYFPVYKNTEVIYCESGEKKFKLLLQELKKAEKFIFLEYFIIQEGIMWDSILEVLVEKVKAGIDVRLMYDDAGCVSTLPAHYKKKMNALGIKCVVFNPLKARLAIQMNNRDHRKIAIIDGLVGFVGGINLADEYINAYERFGHWKDVAVQLKGEAVWSLTIMFLQFWDFLTDDDRDQYLKYKVKSEQLVGIKSDGYIQPFSDSPTDDESAGVTSHLNMINGAKDYIYITTPYLVIGYETVTALINAAKNGVDVRIIVPHVPDKWYVHMVTQSFYPVLVKNGVKIYEYTPGFIHAKILLSDDEIGIVGTINMDFRSYYLHYECGVLMYRCSALHDIKKDYLLTLEESKLITQEDCDSVNIFVRMLRAVLNLFSPLL